MTGVVAEVSIVAENCWTVDELRGKLGAWEEALHAEGYSQSTVWTYLRGGQTFLQWLAREAETDAGTASAR